MCSLASILLAVFALMALQTLTQCFKSTQSSYRAFPGCKEGVASPDSPITTLSVSTPSMCAMSCLKTKTCLAYNICGNSGNRFECYLFSAVKRNKCVDLDINKQCVYMEKQSPCQNDGAWNPPYCACVDGYAGQYCERYIRSCQEAWDLGVRVSKYYMVQPFGSPVAYSIYCNLQHAKTAFYFFVRKRNPSCAPINFDMTWDEYKQGWGDVSCGEYFVGLETMYQLMKYEQFQMHLCGNLTDGGKNIGFFYSNFTIMSEDEWYRMNYEHGFNAGLAGDDGLGCDRPRDFCTRDRDCGSCAAGNGGGCWYSSGCGGYSMTSLLANFLWPFVTTRLFP